MRAYWYEKAGAAAAVMQSGTMPDPHAGPGDVRVRVAHSAINPTDSKRRKIGRELGREPGQSVRIIPNNDGAGIVDQVGTGVAASRIGERVWIFGAQAGRPHGTAADYVVLPSRQAIALPANASLLDGACLGVPAVTAHRGCFADGSIAGKTVLVTGAAGRVGAYAVQLAKWAGARVVATVGSAEKAAAVNTLGADLVVNYNTDDVVAAVRGFTGGAGVDRIVDTAFSSTVQLAPQLLRSNGVIASYSSDADANPKTPFVTLMHMNVLIRPFGIFGMGQAAQDQAFADITGVLTHRIGLHTTFDQMIPAHASMDAGGIWGTAIVDVAGNS
jgi:NADPH:quinone reductase